MNARFDPDLQRKVEYLRKRTGLGTSEILRASVERYYESIRKQGTMAREILEASGFVGGSEGPEDGSLNYKEEVAKYIGNKHGR